MTFEQLPPNDPQAEESVIASILVDPDAVHKIAPMLDARDFFREANAWAYEACLALWQRNEPINQVTVAHELDQRSRLEDVGGLTYLSELILNLPTPIGAESFAAIVKRCAVYRQAISAAATIAQLAYRAPADMGATLAQMEQALQTVRTEAPAMRELTPLRKYIETYWDPEPEPVEGRAGSIRTHLDGLDGLLGTLTSTTFVIVAARTGVGKTNLMLNLARNASVSQGARVAFFSLEMPAEQLVQRLIASVSRVDSKRLRQRDHSEQEERRVMDALGLLAEAPVYIDDSSALRLPELRTKCLQMQRKVGLDLVVVDYLQLILAESRNGNRVQEVSDITRTLKRLAGELQVPIVAGSQLSRAPEQRADHRPQLSDLRESGSIEQDADVVVFIHREEAYWSEEAWIAQHPDAVRDPYPRGLADLIVAKNRHGPTGTVTTRFHAGWALFEAIDDVVDERQAALV